tara:strand:- start:1975 stop:2463 length:489 start_codon:yes stop_codon:yes gene_type:complete
MTYKLDTSETSLKSDVFLIDSSTGVTANDTWNVTKKTGKTYSTSVTLNASNNLVLPSGSSYYLMASPIARQASRNGLIVFQFYDETNSAFIGNEAQLNFSGTFNSTTLQGQKSARVLIESGDITGANLEVSLKIVSVSGGTFQISSTLFTYVGYPSLTVLEV